MKVIHQSFKPKIILSSFYNGKYTDYAIFGTQNTQNQNLLSYSFDRSLENISGSFSFAFKEKITETPIMDKIGNLDLVKIYEFDKLVFMGVVTDTSFSAQSGNIQKKVSVSGKSIEYLFEILQISLDVTALAAAGDAAQIDALNIDFITAINNIKNKETQAIKISDALIAGFNQFQIVLNAHSKVSSADVLEMIKAVYGEKSQSTGKNNEFNITNATDCGDIEFKYPISSNIYQNSIVRFFDWARNILPSPVYEIFGLISNNGNPKITIRECMFSAKNFDGLKSYRVLPELLTSYSLSKSCSEVYTAFLPYVEGSKLSPDFYQKVQSTKEGYSEATTIPEKVSRYGYRPLIVSFVGFDSGKTKKECDKKNDDVSSKMKLLAQSLSEWFGKLDEMYSGSITFVNADEKGGKSTIGERCSLGSNDFYITAEKHDWAFCTAPTITYTVDRGGVYSQGVFSPCKNISKYLGEFTEI